MKKALTLALLLVTIAHTAHSQRADSSTLAVYNTARNFTVLSADFGANITQDLIGEMVLATDAIMVLKEHTQVDSSGKKPLRYQAERRADKISSNLTGKIVVIDFNKDYDVTQMCLNVQRAGAKAMVIIHESNEKKVYKLNPATGVFEDLGTVNTKTIEGNEYYTTYDNEPIDGDNLYRIKLVLNDGTIRYSEEKTVTFHAANGIVLYPNPAHDILNINFKGYTGKAIDITIFDMQGKRLMVQHIDKLQTTDYTLDIPENTAVGQHMILIEAQGKRDVVRLFTIGK